MSSGERRKDFEVGLASLRICDAGPEHVERLRARCLAELAARRRDEARAPGGWRSWSEPAVALGLAAIYLAVAIGNAVALLR
jgi:hypothetical protein